jgi:hypothetical protein
MSVAEPQPVAARPEPALQSPTHRSWPLLARLLVVVIPVVTIASIVWPMVLYPHAAYAADDWLVHLWYVWHQTDWMKDHILPTYYVNYPEGVLYPHFAFNAGPLSAVAGATSLIVGGGGLAAYIIWWTLGVVSAYGALYWLGRMAGLGRLVAQVPALVFVTSAYYITLIYARGDWPEFVGVSSMPLLVASSISIVRAQRLTLGPAAALIVSTVLFTGSHAITLVYGTAFLLVTLTALLAGVPEARRMITRSGALRWTCVVVPAVMVNAWFLVPFGAYQHFTRIGVTNGLSDFMLNLGKPVVRPAALFTLERASAIEPSSQQIVVGLPVLAMAWVLITLVAVLVRRAGSSAWRRTLVVLVVLTTVVTALMMDVGLFLALPAKAQVLQFTYRLESFVLMGVSAAMIAALVLAREITWRIAPAWRLLLVPLVAFSLIAASGQIDRRQIDETLRNTFSDFNSFSIGDYADGSLPEAGGNVPTVTFAWDRMHANHGSATTTAKPGTYVASNLLTVAPLVHVDGAKIVAARTTAGPYDSHLRLALLQVDKNVPPGPVTIRVRPANPWPVVLGKSLSVLGLLGLTANFVAIAVGARRRRRAAVA